MKYLVSSITRLALHLSRASYLDQDQSRSLFNVSFGCRLSSHTYHHISSSATSSYFHRKPPILPPHGNSSRQTFLKLSSLTDYPTAWLLLTLPRSGSSRLDPWALHMLTAPLTQWTKSRARRLPLAKKIELGGVGIIRTGLAEKRKTLNYKH